MGAMTQAADSEVVGWVAPAAAGDARAFEQIVQAYHDDMCRVCTFVAGDPAIAEDAVQLAWAIAWRKLWTMRDPGSVRSWLMRVAVNETRKQLGRRALERRASAPIDATLLPGGVDPATGIESIDLLAAIRQLDPDDRTLLALRYDLGYDATELAAVTGISPAGTRQRLKRLLDRLRAELER